MRDPSNPVCRTISTLLSRIGDKWTVLVVQTLGEGPKRFNELRREIPAVSQRMLTLTLRNLERDGLVSRTVTPTIPASGRLCADRAWQIASEADLRARDLGLGPCRRNPRRTGALRRPARLRGRVSTAPQLPNLWALLDRGDELARSGDEKAAMSFYQAAIGAARGPLSDPRTVQRLRMAQTFIQRRVKEFQHSLDRAVADLKPADTKGRTRLSHALDMLKGNRSIYPQQPAVFYYPYLAQRQFFERQEFDWVAKLEAMTPAIREELLALLSDERISAPMSKTSRTGR